MAGGFHIPPEKLHETLAAFDRRNAVTHGVFEFRLENTLADMEWNHMDQLHRPFIHHTYQENIRIASGRDYALSLTRWGKWPLLILVTDMRLAPGLFYQSFVLAGLVHVHNVIALTETGDEVLLKLDWYIHSHRFLKPLHFLLDRKFHRLNARLQEEDAQVRNQRFALRKKGYSFRSDPPDYVTSNTLTNNTVYPKLPENAFIPLASAEAGRTVRMAVGEVDFLLRSDGGDYLLWPAACPHEGGELEKGTLREDCRLECPWHGLPFAPARVSAAKPQAKAYGFIYMLEAERIRVSHA